MKLIGILSWYEESPSWLAAAIASLACAGVNHLVAVDGAYFLFPEGRARSGGEQHAAVTETAHACGMGLSLHTPGDRWAGNEVEKRSYSFALAELVAEEGDWYFVMDADQLVTSGGEFLRDELAATELDAASAIFWQRHDPQASPVTADVARQFNWKREHTFEVRNLFRALPGLRVEGNHYTYVLPDGRKLWGGALDPDLAPAAQTSLRIEHRTDYRDRARTAASKEYYARRERLGVERGTCARCRIRRADVTLPWDWEEVEGFDGLQSAFIEVCRECEPEARAEGEATVRELGYEPAALGLDPAPRSA